MHPMKTCLLECFIMIFRVGSMEPALPSLGHLPVEWVDEWYNEDATAAMLENPSLPADLSTVQATQKDQQASWDDDPYHTCHIPGAVIPPSTHSPPPHPSDCQAPPGPKVLKAESQTNHGLATNTHTLVGDKPILWDLQAIMHPLPKGSNSQDPFKQLSPLWAGGAQQPSVGSHFTPDSSHTSPPSLPPNVLHFSDNPHPPSSKASTQPWHKDTITLNKPCNLPIESSAAQEEHHTFRVNSHNYPTSHYASEPMGPHAPLPHLPAQAGPEIQTVHTQNTGLGTSRTNPTGLFGQKSNPWDLHTITNQLTNGPNSQEYFENLTSLSPFSAPQFMSHDSLTNLASGFSHMLHLPKNSQQPSFKTTTPQSKQKTLQRISKLKPSTEPLKKKPARTKIWAKPSSSLSQTTDVISMPPDTEMYTCLEESRPLPSEINELTPHLGPLEFHMTLFEDDSPQEPLELARRRIFQHKIEKLPGKLLIILEEKFQATHSKYLGHKGCILPHITANIAAGELQRNVIGKIIEFQRDMKLWYHRWHMITSFDFETYLLLPHSSSERIALIINLAFSLYLFYVEMICSIVPRDSTTSRDLKTELKSAQESFNILSNNPSKLLQSRLGRSNHEFYERLTLHILWTYLGHWMRNERPGVFKMVKNSDDVVNGTKSFFNRAFAFSYSAVARRYIGKK